MLQLKAKIDELEASVTTKEIEWEELDADIKKTTIENQRYNDRSTQFKEIYIKVDQLEARKTQLQEDLESASYSLQALDGDFQTELPLNWVSIDGYVYRYR
jgi:DNA repair protein RAD50